MQKLSPQNASSTLASLALVMTAVAGCQAPLTLDGSGETIIGNREAAIVNGQITSGHPSVGRLQIGSSGLCTATLVGKKTVITASHCVHPGSIHVFHLGGKVYPAAQALRYPQYNTTTHANDVALILLQTAPPVAPSAIAITPPKVGLGVTLIGYGVTSEYAKDAGTKRIAHNTISQMDATRMVFLGSSGNEGNTCYGDSGGPAFATLKGHEVVVGVTSGGTAPCGTDGIDTRVDAFKSWLISASGGDILQGSAAPPKDTTKPQVAIRSPQDGATLSATQVTVAASASDDKGVTRVELRVNGQIAGSRSASPYDFAVALPEGHVTLTATAFDAAGNSATATSTVTVQVETQKPAPTPSPTPGVFGTPCASPGDCQSGLCVDDGSGGGKFCTEHCNATMNNCPQDADCLPTNVASYVCGTPKAGTPQDPALKPSEGQGTSSFQDQELVGSCAVATGAPTPAPPVALLILLGALLIPRRRGRP